MSRRLTDFTGKRRHCPIKVRGETCMKAISTLRLTVAAASSPPAPELVVTVWQCTAAGCASWLTAVSCTPHCCHQLTSNILPTPPLAPLSFTWETETERTLNSTFSSARSRPCIWIHSRPVSCDWLGGSVMLADGSVASSHCSATSTVIFDCTDWFGTHSSQEAQASCRILRCLETFHKRKWGLLWSRGNFSRWFAYF